MMSRQPIGVGSYVHVCNRGVKKLPIYREEKDLHRMLLNLFYLNHRERMPDHWKRVLGTSEDTAHLAWHDDEWGERSPIVSILAFNILDNHLHLILKEVTEGGTSKFMHRTSMAHSKSINEKYGESGSLFQGAFKSRTIDENVDFCNVAVYVMVKNAFEKQSGGLPQAIKNFDEAYERASEDPFNSLGIYAGIRESPIIEKDLLGELFETPESFKEFARETMLRRLDELASLEAEFE